MVLMMWSKAIDTIIHAIGQSIDEYTINRSSIQLYLQLHRSEQAAKFNPQKPMLLYLDGKLVEDLTESSRQSGG